MTSIDVYVAKAKQQFIDSNGKCRALIYGYRGHNIALLTRPLPPTLKPITPEIIVNPVAPIAVILKFLVEFKLQITKQHQSISSKPGFVGLTVSNPDVPLLDSIYIITDYPTALPGIEIHFGSANPISTSTSSSFDIFRRSRKAADVVMAYVLWTYSSRLKFSESGGWLDPERDNFTIIPPREIDNYEADVLSLGSRLFFENNDTIYDPQGRIKVPNELTITKLLSWLSVRKVRTPHLIETYWENKTIPDYYKTISDFSAADHQLVFTNVEGLMRWRKNVKKGSVKNQTIVSELDTTTPNPYFYFWKGGSGDQLVMLQNVKDGDKKLADFVATYWAKHRRNPGHNPKVEGQGKASLVGLEDPISPSVGGLVSQQNGKYFAILMIERND